MKATQLKFANRVVFFFLIILSSLAALSSCKDGGIFSRKTTIYGTITEIAGGPVDSIQLTLTAAKGIGNFKPLFRVATDKDGNYVAVMDVPHGYGHVELAISYVDNPAFTKFYRGYEVYEDGELTNFCCTVMTGKKKRYDFKMY
jgi:hypothetical protein